MSKINCYSKGTIALTSITNEERKIKMKKNKFSEALFISVEIMFKLRFKRLRSICMRLREINRNAFQTQTPSCHQHNPHTDLEAQCGPQNIVHIPLFHLVPSIQILIIFYDKG